jgi:hypothetical protein
MRNFPGAKPSAPSSFRPRRASSFATDTDSPVISLRRRASINAARWLRRLAKLALDETERPKIDPDFEEATEGEEVERKEKLKTKWAQLEAVVGAEKRLNLVARDIVEHFEKQ